MEPKHAIGELSLAGLESAGTGFSARGRYLHVGHEHPDCTLRASVPGASDEAWLTTEVEAEAGQPLCVRCTDEGENGAPIARFAYHYSTSWRLASRARG